MSDLIDRHAAIDALKPCAGVGNRALEKLRALPSAEPRWIPCGERLPEEDGYYLVTNSKWGAPWREITLWVTDGWSSDNKPIAWMPLPEPYREEKNNDGSD